MLSQVAVSERRLDTFFYRVMNCSSIPSHTLSESASWILSHNGTAPMSYAADTLLARMCYAVKCNIVE